MQQWHHFVYLMCCIGTKIWIWIWWGFAARNGHLGAAAGRDAILFNVNSEFQPATPILSSSNSEFQLLQSIPAICPAQPGIISSAEQAAERPHPSSKPHEALVAHPIQTRVGGRDHEVAGLRSLEHNVPGVRMLYCNFRFLEWNNDSATEFFRKRTESSN